MESSNGEFVAFGVGQMQGVGPVYARRMFGGVGLYVDDLMIALVAAGSLCLTVDDQSRRLFEAQGLQPFTFNRKGMPVAMFYFQAPEEVLEDIEAMNRWANEAYSAAMRSARKRCAAGVDLLSRRIRGRVRLAARCDAEWHRPIG